MLFLPGNLLSNAKKPFLEVDGSADTFGFNLAESNPLWNVKLFWSPIGPMGAALWAFLSSLWVAAGVGVF